VILPDLTMRLATVAASMVDAVQDSSAVAYVPKASGPPDSSPYMWLGYAITFAAYGGYIVLLLRRMARARRP